MIWRATAVSLFILLLSGPMSPAGETVHFANGRRMRVESSRLEGGRLYVLQLGNGGVIQVPAATVERIEADPPSGPVKTPDSGGGKLEIFLAGKRAGGYRDLIRRAAREHQLEEGLLAAVVSAESAFDPLAVSPKGAMGLMQLMPDTADRFGVKKPFDPWENLNAGAAYLSWLSNRFGGDLRLALAAYNAGEGRVEAYQGMPPFSETIQYVSRVISLYHSFSD